MRPRWLVLLVGASSVLFPACGDEVDAPKTHPGTIPNEPCTLTDPASWPVSVGVVAWGYRCTFDTYASLSARDLNADGVADIVANDTRDGANRKIAAFDGSTGEVLWSSPTDLMLVSNVGFVDMNGDRTNDILATGRGEPITAKPVVALDGRTGSALWVAEQIDPPWQNVYAPQVAGDLDDDGVDDWLVATGGDNIRKADERPAIPGRLVALSRADGAVLGSVAVPDDQEIYCSPILVEDASDEPFVLVGTGGEVFSGSFWRVPVRDVVTSRASRFEELVSGGGRTSFIAPPSVGDLDGDGDDDVVVAAVDGTVFALDPFADGGSRVMWTSEAPGASPAEREAGTALLSVSFTVPALGQMDDDPALEVVVTRKAMTKVALAAGRLERGPMSYAVLDGATGHQEAIQTIDEGESVASPLVIGQGAEAVVACACVPHPGSEPTYGLWSPTTGLVADLGLVGLKGATPIASVLPAGLPGDPTVMVVLAAAVPGSNDHVVIRVDIPGTDVSWGGYLGTLHDGHLTGTT